MEATQTGRNGVRVVPPVDKAFKNESDCATTQNQPMGADRAADPALTPENVKLDSVLVRSQFRFVFFCVFFATMFWGYYFLLQI